MNTTVADFTEVERELVTEILQQRYSKAVLPELADSELRFDPASEEVTSCPTLYWSECDVNFVVLKVAQDRFKCQFFYLNGDQHGTGHEEYSDLRRCVLTLLSVQAEHARQSAGISIGSIAADMATKTVVAS